MNTLIVLYTQIMIRIRTYRSILETRLQVGYNLTWLSQEVFSLIRYKCNQLNDVFDWAHPEHMDFKLAQMGLLETMILKNQLKRKCTVHRLISE